MPGSAVVLVQCGIILVLVGVCVYLSLQKGTGQLSFVNNDDLQLSSTSDAHTRFIALRGGELSLLEDNSNTVCLINFANNPRTASLFARGMLERHGSVHRFTVISPTEECPFGSTRISLVSEKLLMDWCLGDDFCIVTGDEVCAAPGASDGELLEYLTHVKLFGVDPQRAASGHIDGDDRRIVRTDHPDFPHQQGFHRLRPKVILREFYSSKYDHPAVALGARIEFKPVSIEDRDRGNRPIMINFMGSIKAGIEIDRERMQAVINGHRWKVPTKFKIFSNLVRNPNTTTKDDYRETLLDSSFTLAPVGTADDCFRFWEAIEAGSIPIFVRRIKDDAHPHHCPDAFEDVLRANPPIVLLNSWEELPRFVETVTEAEIDARRQELQDWSKRWWTNTSHTVDMAIQSALDARASAKKVETNELLDERAREIKKALNWVNRQRGKKALDADAMDELIKKQPSVAHGQDRPRAAAPLGPSLMGAVAGDKILQDFLLDSAAFNFVHDVVREVTKVYGYLDNFFSPQELDRRSAYLQFPLNRAAYIDKLLKAVANDLDISEDILSHMTVPSGGGQDQLRLFLCFVTDAARLKNREHFEGGDARRQSIVEDQA